jgi:aminoglycoside phosphotransferase (APT) family kinase protein
VTQGRDLSGGSSPGLTALLRTRQGPEVFVKAVGTRHAPEARLHREEAVIAAALSPDAPAPRLLGVFEDEDWVGLVFEAIPGRPPQRTWPAAEAARVLALVSELAAVGARAPEALPPSTARRPRLGGWRWFGEAEERPRRLAEVSPWAARHLEELCALEQHGLRAAHGASLVHFDLHTRNVLVGEQQVWAVDWAFATRGNPLIDLVTLLSSMSAEGVEAEPYAAEHPLAAQADPGELNGLIAAHAGFCLAASFRPTSARRQPILDLKREIGLGALRWLAARVALAPLSVH